MPKVGETRAGEATKKQIAISILCWPNVVDSCHVLLSIQTGKTRKVLLEAPMSRESATVLLDSLIAGEVLIEGKFINR